MSSSRFPKETSVKDICLFRPARATFMRTSHFLSLTDFLPASLVPSSLLLLLRPLFSPTVFFASCPDEVCRKDVVLRGNKVPLVSHIYLLSFIHKKKKKKRERGREGRGEGLHKICLLLPNFIDITIVIHPNVVENGLQWREYSKEL